MCDVERAWDYLDNAIHFCRLEGSQRSLRDLHGEYAHYKKMQASCINHSFTQVHLSAACEFVKKIRHMKMTNWLNILHEHRLELVLACAWVALRVIPERPKGIERFATAWRARDAAWHRRGMVIARLVERWYLHHAPTWRGADLQPNELRLNSQWRDMFQTSEASSRRRQRMLWL